MASGTLTKDVILNLEINDQEAVNNIAALTKKVDELKAKQILLNKQQRDLAEQLKKGEITEIEYTKALEKKYEEIAKNDALLKETKRSLGAYQKELQNNLVAEKAEIGSLDAMRAKLLNMRKVYESLSEVERNSDVGQKQQQEIADLTQSIKDLEYAQLDFKRNVGNYPETTQSAKQALREMTIECQNLAVALSQSEGRIQAQNTLLQTLATTVGTDSQEYRDAAAELDRMNKEYDTSKQKLNEMTAEAGKLRDTIGDVNKNIQSFADDQQKIAAMQEGVSVLTSAYTILQGSMKALGIESKSLLEVYARIQIVQQSINSLMTIYKALNKDSNLMIVLRNKLEQARLVWSKAYAKSLEEQNAALITNTAAEGANAAATTATATAEGVATAATFSLKAAFDALKATLLTNPFTAIIVGLLAVGSTIAAVVKKIVKSNKEAKQSEKELAEQAKKTSEDYKKAVDKRVSAMNSSAKSYTEQIAKVKSLLAVVHSETAAYEAKRKAMNELNRLVPSYNGHLSKTGQIVRENSAAIDKYIKDLQRQAEATATMNALISAYEDKLEADRRKREDERNKRYYENQLNTHEDMLANARSVGDNETVAKATKYVEYYQKKLNAVKNDLNDVNNEVKNADKEIEYFLDRAKDLNINATGSTPTNSTGDAKENPAVKAAEEQYEEMTKIVKDYYSELEKMADDSVKTLTEKENLRYKGESEQLAKAKSEAESLYETLSKDPKLLAELQKKNKSITLENLQKQITDLNNELDNAAQRHNDNLERINNDTKAAFDSIMSKLKTDIDSASQDLTVAYSAQLKARLDALDEELKKELEAHEYTEEQKLELAKLYEEKKAQVIRDFSQTNVGDYSNLRNTNTIKSQLASDIADLEARKEAELSVFQGTEEQKAEIVKKYADLRAKYEENASKQETKVWMDSTMAIASALSTSMSNMSELFNTLAEDDEKMNKYAKELAMGQIILAAAVATAQAVVAAINAGKDTGLGAAVTIPLFLVEFMGIVAGVITQAKQTLSTANASKPRFAEGGLVGTRTTNKTDDKIDAKLSEGEYVIKSKVVEKYGVKFFDLLNYGRSVTHSPKTAYAEGGTVAPMSVIHKVDNAFTMEDFKTAMAEALEEMPAPQVAVTEINRVQKRVQVKEEIAKLK